MEVLSVSLLRQTVLGCCCGTCLPELLTYPKEMLNLELPAESFWSRELCQMKAQVGLQFSHFSSLDCFSNLIPCICLSQTHRSFSFLSNETWKTLSLFLNSLFSQTCQMMSLKMEQQPLRSGLFPSLLATCLMKTACPLPTQQSPPLLTSAPAPISPPLLLSTELTSRLRARAQTAAAVTPAETLSLSPRTCHPPERQQWLGSRPPPGHILKLAKSPPMPGAIVSL